jgi:electron transfer flavoprotein alpha subunit
VASEAVAVIVIRDGRVPAGADQAVAEAGGTAVIVESGAAGIGGSDAPAVQGSGPAGMVGSGGGGAPAVGELLPSARRLFVADSAGSPAQLAGALAGGLAGSTLVILPGSPDGRDLAPRLAARLDRPLLAGAVGARVDGGRVEADLLRVDGRVVVPAVAAGAAVVTLWPGARDGAPVGRPPEITTIGLDLPAADASVQTGAMIEPDPATMDLAEATRVIAGGAGLIPAGADDAQAHDWFALLAAVASALGASAGATRVITDAGWMGYDRQIGTTGVTLQPDLYVALGISGASQHVGGIGDPSHVISVNLDPSCPMTSLADLGLVTDAPALLLELATRLGVPVPDSLDRRASGAPTPGPLTSSLEVSGS